MLILTSPCQGQTTPCGPHLAAQAQADQGPGNSILRAPVATQTPPVQCMCQPVDLPHRRQDLRIDLAAAVLRCATCGTTIPRSARSKRITAFVMGFTSASTTAWQLPISCRRYASSEGCSQSPISNRLSHHSANRSGSSSQRVQTDASSRRYCAQELGFRLRPAIPRST